MVVGWLNYNFWRDGSFDFGEMNGAPWTRKGRGRTADGIENFLKSGKIQANCLSKRTGPLLEVKSEAAVSVNFSCMSLEIHCSAKV